MTSQVQRRANDHAQEAFTALQTLQVIADKGVGHQSQSAALAVLVGTSTDLEQVGIQLAILLHARHVGVLVLCVLAAWSAKHSRQRLSGERAAAIART